MIRSKYIATYCFVFLFAVISWSQNEQVQQALDEEVVRYIGFEENLTRYVSLPYDATMNHNVKGNFLDIGFILLMLVPLLFVWRTRSRLWRIVLIGLLFFMMICSMGSAHVQTANGMMEYAARSDALRAAIASGEFTGLRALVANIYVLCGQIYAPIADLLTMVTSHGDHITYPILLGIIYLLYFVYEKFGSRNSHFLLGAFLLFYGFYMLILSAGIIWYGFLLFPLLYLEIAKYVPNKTYRPVLLGGTVLFVLLSYFLKISHTTSRSSDVSFGMLQPPVHAYNFSQISMNEFYEGYFANIGTALDRINAEDHSLIYKSGTFVSYLIDNNDDRIFQDDVLGFFDRLVKKYKTKQQINRALKASGFKYILVSPRLHLMDRTPDKSLVSKFQKMASYLDRNGGLKLLATNRFVRYVDENGVTKQEYVVKYGQDVEVIQDGTYAIFEIL